MHKILLNVNGLTEYGMHRTGLVTGSTFLHFLRLENIVLVHDNVD